MILLDELPSFGDSGCIYFNLLSHMVEPGSARVLVVKAPKSVIYKENPHYIIIYYTITLHYFYQIAMWCKNVHPLSFQLQGQKCISSVQWPVWSHMLGCMNKNAHIFQGNSYLSNAVRERYSLMLRYVAVGTSFTVLWSSTFHLCNWDLRPLKWREVIYSLSICLCENHTPLYLMMITVGTPQFTSLSLALWPYTNGALCAHMRCDPACFNSWWWA